MAISAIISIGLPIVLFIILYKKYNAKIIPMIMGIAGFILFALIFERSIHSIVFKKFTLKEKPLIYIIYGIFMAGIFEETARFISFKILKKKYNGIGTGLAYGIGHGGVEAALFVGLSMINTMILAIILNAGNIETITGKLQGEVFEQINTQITAILTTSPYLFLASGIERIFAICIQLSLSIIVFYSVYEKNKLWLYPFSIILHAIIDIPAAAMQVGVIKNMFLVEILLFIGAILSIIIAKFTHEKLKQNIIKT
ncbi:MAG: YhfC family intramembrane metalloprotease [Treponema sp.]|nr:YhfC family intramembrane metalloprotease [Treponema sp.]